jgi:hypothetical protein
MTASAVSRKKAKRQARNGWRTNFNDELKLGENQQAWIKVTSGKYLVDGDEYPYYPAVIYNVKWQEEGREWPSYEKIRGQDEGMCTLQERSIAEDDRVQRGWSEPGSPNRYYYNVIYFDLFHRTTVTDKEGNPKLYKRGKLQGQPIYSWQPVKAVRERKDLLANGNPEDICFFRKKFLSLSVNQQKVISRALNSAQFQCQCGGNLAPVVYVCSECEEVMLDVEGEGGSLLTEDEIKAYGSDNRRCRDCGHFGLPQAHSICDACDDPRPLDPDNVVLRIKKTSASGYASYVITDVQPLAEFELMNKEPVLTPDGELTEDIKNLADNQFDFAGYTAPLSNEEWSERLNLSPGQPGYAESTRSYGKFR